MSIEEKKEKIIELILKDPERFSKNLIEFLKSRREKIQSFWKEKYNVDRRRKNNNRMFQKRPGKSFKSL